MRVCTYIPLMVVVSDFVYTCVHLMVCLRFYSGSVLCVGTAMSGEVCFSADEFGEIRIWQLPIEISDPFDSYGELLYYCIYHLNYVFLL